MSAPIKMNEPVVLRRVMMDTHSDDEISDSENFDDIRMELNATGHNLTSVLINPRETIFDNIFDEFATEQSAPLDYDSPLAAAASLNSFFGYSSHSAVTTMSRSSGAGSAHKKAQSQHNFTAKASVSSNGRNSNNGNMLTANTMYNTTPAEDAQLDQLIVRLKKVFSTYQHIHGMENHTDRYSNPTNGHIERILSPRKASHGASMANLKARGYSSDDTEHRSPRGSHNNNNNNAHGKGKYTKLAGDELRTCYREVPELFFRPDFSLLSPEIFNQTLLIKDVAGAEGLSPTSTHKKGVQKLAQFGRTYSTEDVLEVMQRQGLDGRSHDVLSYYLDLVEVALLRQIWLRSPAFFRALDDIKELQSQVSETTKIVHTARTSLVAANTAATADPARIPTLATRQRNCQALQETLLSVQRVVQGRAAIVALLDAEDYFNAMELISVTKGVYHAHLANIVALRPLGNQLDDIDNLVCEVMCNKFVSMAIQWEDPHSQKIGTNGSIGSTTPNSNTSDILYEELDGLADFTHANLSVPITTNDTTANASTENTTTTTTTTTPKLTMEASLKQLLQSLILTERTQSALNMYKHRLLDAIKLIVRTCVMEYLTHFDPSMAYDDNSFDTNMSGSGTDPAYGNTETPFAQKVREMKADNFLSCLSMCFEHVMVSVQKANLFHQFIETHLNANIGTFEASVAETANVNSKSSTSAEVNTSDDASPEARIHTEEYKQVQINMISMSKTCLAAACDLAQRSISQLINLRKDANAKLNPEKMKFMWEISLDFVLSLETVSGTTAYIIRQCLQAQTKSFLDYLHETCKGKLVVTLDNERWVQCDVSAERQVQIDRLSSGKAFLPHAQSGSMPKSASNTAIHTHNTTTTAITSEIKRVTKDKESRPVIVDGVSFKVVWSAMLLVEVIQAYLDVALHFAPVTTDVINKTVEMLKLFDHRSRQLVLGAQAIQSAARLKSISVKHLALTGQSIGLLLALLPHIRAALLAQLPAKHQLLLTELDRVSHDLLEHHNQIVAKFVAIISDHVDNLALTTLKTLDWDHFQGLRCDYFEEVQKAVINIHRVLQTTLPQSQVQDVFSRIFALLNRKIPTHFEEINPNTQTGRQRILDEITHLVTAFSRIKQIDASALTDSLEDTFRKRYVRDR